MRAEDPTFEVFHTAAPFFNAQQDPEGALILGSDGNFYGTTRSSNNTSDGTIFKLTPGGTITILHTFTALDNNTGANTDGGYPRAALVQGSDGNFYGTAEYGGANGAGTVFKITPAGAFTILHSFDPAAAQSEGGNPSAALVQGADGNFYGVALRNGASNHGTIFKITPTGAFSVLHSFGAYADSSSDNTDGAAPSAALLVGSDKALYGTAAQGGAAGFGTVFKITTGGAFTTLHSFGTSTGDGAYPYAALISGGDGFYYGTASSGTVFKMTPAGTITNLHSFSAPDASGNNADGTSPTCALVRGGDGVFYGVASYGGAHANGTAFKITAGGALTVLHSFDATDYDGVHPGTSLVEGKDGLFYGTTGSGGAYGYGLAYKITSAGTLSAVQSFGLANSEEAYSTSSLVEGGDGSFYGTSTSGGAHSAGSIFKVSPIGTLTVLYSFSALGNDHVNADGASPEYGLTLGPDGNFYGTTGAGGTYRNSTIFRITPDGKFTTLHSINPDTDGTDTRDPLVLARDGNFYGVNNIGGTAANIQGTIFRITPGGLFTVVHIFGVGSGGSPVMEGSRPLAGLTLGADGNLYGTTGGGGTRTDFLNNGTVFKCTTDGTLSTLYTFDGGTGSGSPGGDPDSVLVQGSDGNFYGTTLDGGANGAGTIFRITPAGALTVLYNVGSSPTELTRITSALTLGGNGLFYGVGYAGTAFAGKLFQMTTTGSVAIQHSFGDIDGLGFNQGGYSPIGRVLQGGDGNFYATAYEGGKGAAGVIYAFGDHLLPIVTSATTASATVGQAFSYQIVATETPSSYGESGLPSGLAINQTTGKISGTPTKAGTYSVTVAAFNSNGHGSATLILTVKPAPPVITSATTATASEGTAFSYQITASNSPTKYGESGLPAGLSIDQTTGKISGTPTAPGTYSVTIAAFNSAGSGTAKLALTVKAAAPKITSSLSASAAVGKAFSYQITATNSPAKYGESGLPAGLSINQTTGKITGAPTKTGTYSVTIAAFNSTGSGTATLKLTITN